MKLAFQLAYKNLIGAGLRTCLNVIVLSFAFVMIIFFNGLMDGWNQQARKDTIEWEYGYGQLKHPDYDAFDAFSIQDGHGEIPHDISKELIPIFIQQASIYPEGRMISIVLKGIDPEQNILSLPTKELKNNSAFIPAIIGKRMAEMSKLEKGDEVLLRWRDKNGTFDAGSVTIVDVFDNNVASIDKGQVCIPLSKLYEMSGYVNHTTLFVAGRNYQYVELNGWRYKSQEDLLSDLDEIISMKKYSSSILYLLLLAIALLAIFDTQVLSIFRRQKEIGTYISLGMTRRQVVGLFTVEGSMYSLLAMIFGCAYGIPFFAYLAKVGIAIPKASQEMGISIAENIYPVFGDRKSVV